MYTALAAKMIANVTRVLFEPDEHGRSTFSRRPARYEPAAIEAGNDETTFCGCWPFSRYRNTKRHLRRKMEACADLPVRKGFTDDA